GRGVLFGRLVAHHPHALWFQDGDHARKVVTAPQDPAVDGPHAVGALAAGFLRTLLDLVERGLAGAPVDAEERAVGQSIERVVTPLARGDHAAIESEQAI